MAEIPEEKYEYDFGFLDTQWLLNRNMQAMCRQHSVKIEFYQELLDSVVYSIIKYVKMFKCRKWVLLNDRGPYHKKTILDDESYKGTRYYAKEEDCEESENNIEVLKKQLAAKELEYKEITDILQAMPLAEEIAVLKDQIQEEQDEIDQIMRQVHNQQMKYQAGYILRHLDLMGLPCFGKKGWEADDLAYLVSNKLEKEGKTGILVSVDSDWGYWLRPNIEWYRTNRDEVYGYWDVREENDIPEELTNFEYKKLYDSIYGSHNDLGSCVHPEWKLTVLKEWYEKSENKAEVFEQIYHEYDLRDKANNQMDMLHEEYKSEGVSDELFERYLGHAFEKGLLDISFTAFYKEYKVRGASKELFEDPEHFKLQLQTFEFEKFPEYDVCLRMVDHIDDKCPMPSHSQWEAYRSGQGMLVASKSWFSMIDTMDKSQFQDS